MQSDPILFLHRYPLLKDREVVALVTSCLAYGRVAQILSSVSAVLDRMGGSPLEFLKDSSPKSLGAVFQGFRHRFSTGEELSSLLVGLRHVVRRHGSLEACVASGLTYNGGSVTAGLGRLVDEVCASGTPCTTLLPQPGRGSACKRLNLFLRWMVRADHVDPGGWTSVSPSALIVPLDVHMYRLARNLGMTQRRQADMKTAQEVTVAFREICPDDPTRYDFALTRLGMLGCPVAACMGD